MRGHGSKHPKSVFLLCITYISTSFAFGRLIDVSKSGFVSVIPGGGLVILPPRSDFSLRWEHLKSGHPVATSRLLCRNHTFAAGLSCRLRDVRRQACICSAATDELAFELAPSGFGKSRPLYISRSDESPSEFCRISQFMLNPPAVLSHA